MIKHTKSWIEGEKNMLQNALVYAGLTSLGGGFLLSLLIQWFSKTAGISTKIQRWIGFVICVVLSTAWLVQLPEIKNINSLLGENALLEMYFQGPIFFSGGTILYWLLSIVFNLFPDKDYWGEGTLGDPFKINPEFDKLTGLLTVCRQQQIVQPAISFYVCFENRILEISKNILQRDAHPMPVQFADVTAHMLSHLDYKLSVDAHDYGVRLVQS